MTNLQKSAIVIAINTEKERLGSYGQVATKADVSTATISQMVNEKWELIKDELWLKVGKACGWDDSEWQIAETINYKKVSKICTDAKAYNLFMIISDKAGIGKSAPLKTFSQSNAETGVFYIRCREWAKREFLTELCSMLGIDTGKSYIHIDKLGMKVCEFFRKRTGVKPLLIVDEADKLKDSALRWFIHLYNENEDEMGLIIAGTPHLEQRISRGVKLKKLGFDEIESRFGRAYINLIGATANCVKKICAANGVNDPATQKMIFDDLKPVFKEIPIEKNQVQNVKVIEDLRRLKRMVIREKIKLQNI
ncbi:AAA family ATPase [Chryseobacterium arthrosphaerae]|uniref:AAA family ATPase n=1 Tax=Chryseobacterium arthrosphaerae TaxID=651561 RepID=A0ABU7R2T2_9FLAO|nr:AAA family ATPase [Chryseobacterium arthrosphaerae]AYZ12917.1 ATP-binding protein [Chryseobacterium arthrosphaerae]